MTLTIEQIGMWRQYLRERLGSETDRTGTKCSIASDKLCDLALKGLTTAEQSVSANAGSIPAESAIQDDQRSQAGQMRVLGSDDSFCPFCGHNRDKTSVSSIDCGNGTKACQICNARWLEIAAPAINLLCTEQDCPYFGKHRASTCACKTNLRESAANGDVKGPEAPGSAHAQSDFHPDTTAANLPDQPKQVSCPVCDGDYIGSHAPDCGMTDQPHSREELERELKYGKPPARKQPPGEVVVSCNPAGQCVAVTRQDDEGQILSVIWEQPPARTDGMPVDPDRFCVDTAHRQVQCVYATDYDALRARCVELQAELGKATRYRQDMCAKHGQYLPMAGCPICLQFESAEYQQRALAAEARCEELATAHNHTADVLADEIHAKCDQRDRAESAERQLADITSERNALLTSIQTACDEFGEQVQPAFLADKVADLRAQLAAQSQWIPVGERLEWKCMPRGYTPSNFGDVQVILPLRRMAYLHNEWFTIDVELPPLPPQPKGDAE